MREKERFNRRETNRTTLRGMHTSDDVQEGSESSPRVDGSPAQPEKRDTQRSTGSGIHQERISPAAFRSLSCWAGGGWALVKDVRQGVDSSPMLRRKGGNAEAVWTERESGRT